MQAAQPLKLTSAEYLQGELLSEQKHQFIGGDVFAMTGASAAHNIISLNIASELRAQLKGKSCTPFMADMKVKAQGDFYYPDVMLICDPHPDDTEYVKHAPAILVEVLSKSTRAVDHSIKQVNYLQLASLLYYVLVEQDICEICVLSREQGWIPKYYYLGDEIVFAVLNLKLNVNDIYQAIDNEDKQLYLAQQATD